MQRPTAALLAALSCAAVTRAAAQQLPPITPLLPVTATSRETFGLVAGVRDLPGGRVLVNDVMGRRLVLLDSTLATIAVVADSSAVGAGAYGPRGGALVAYRGDSSFFVDPASLSMTLLDGAGKAVRIVAVPRSEDVMALMLIGAVGGAGVDGAGRLVYRAANLPSASAMGALFANPNPKGFTMPAMPDSAPIVRADLATHKLDTAAFLKVPTAGQVTMTRGDDGKYTVSAEVNPLPIADDWAMTSDGSIAIVRGRDYHVDWIAPDGTRRSTPKIAYEWQRLSDDDKAAFIDSVKAARERLLATQFGAAGSMAAGAMAATGMKMNIDFVSPSELPDYKPPFFTGAVKADLDGNLWVRSTPTRKIPGGPVYDVVSARGELAARMQAPEGRAVVGFGAGGVVYLMSQDGKAWRLERARRP